MAQSLLHSLGGSAGHATGSFRSGAVGGSGGEFPVPGRGTPFPSEALQSQPAWSPQTESPTLWRQFAVEPGVSFAGEPLRRDGDPSWVSSALKRLWHRGIQHPLGRPKLPLPPPMQEPQLEGRQQAGGDL